MSFVRATVVAALAVTAAGCGSRGAARSSAPCAPKDAACNPVPSDCLALHAEAGGEASTLRVAQIRLTKPAALTRTTAPAAVTAAVAPNLRGDCHVRGLGTFNALLRFDRTTDKLTIGFAKPVDDPARGYAFLDGALGGGHVEPVVTRAPVQPDGRFAAAPVDALAPVFFGDEVAVVPVRGLQVSGQLSSGGLCIGRFNAGGLEPANGCAATEKTPAFVDGGIVRGVVKLEDADAVLLPGLDGSLCAFLAGEGDGGSPARCRRDGGRIAFQGDWCSTTNAPATPACADAVQVAGTFAASAVRFVP